MRSGKELLIASRQYASEQRWRSWACFWTTLALTTGFLTLACLNLPLPICIVSSVVASLLLIRMFILYHDFMHGAILANSRLAGAILKFYGLLVLSPPRLWKHSHDDHHQNNARKFGPTLGTFPVMSTVDFAQASRWQRNYYALTRHPMTLLGGYFTIFFWKMCLHAFLVNPRKNYDGGLAILVHVSVAVALSFVSFQALILGMFLPMAIISCIGSYFFYAQHNFPGLIRRNGAEWDHVHAALHSSSFMRMGAVMNWFTGNIGYHHVHHLNAKIPFYRLPEAMAGLRELQSPAITTLHPLDIMRCLQLKLWDPTAERLLTFREAAKCNS